jgi:hypothetical protein
MSLEFFEFKKRERLPRICNRFFLFKVDRYTRYSNFKTTNLSVGFSLKRSVQLLENILTNGRYNFYASLKIYKYISRKIFHVQHNIL